MGNSCSTNQSCEWNLDPGAVVSFEADPDVAGIGVIAAFFISAWLAFVIALFTYNLVDGVMDENTPGIATIDLKLRTWVLNRIEGTGVDKTREYIRKRVTKEKMQEVCLMLSDQQLVTGAAILIVGYMKHCEITQYHFYIAANLTLVSFATYQSVLPIVRDVLQINIRRGWRMGWITILSGSVLTLNLIIYNDNFLVPQYYGLSMDCFWRQLPGGFIPPIIPYVVVGIVVDLLSGYFIASCLYPEIRDLRPVKYLERKASKLLSQPTYIYQSVERHLLSSRRFMEPEILQPRLMMLSIPDGPVLLTQPTRPARPAQTK
ncbi:hypothetical protein E8E14_011560 [Neopestalotiopsis sp. 37M]|nr:hypothetical protein E8E14_011560 [Neopestalotiopsis sp. 37M]